MLDNAYVRCACLTAVGPVAVLAVALLASGVSVAQRSPASDSGSHERGTHKEHGATHALSASACSLPTPPSRDILKVLATQCCTQSPFGDSHCLHYSQNNKFVTVKDAAVSKPFGYLILPSIAVTGIEQTSVTEADPVAEFWQYGWDQGMNYYLKKPASHTALAINSLKGRDQDQLHIHISCVLQSVATQLAGTAQISANPTQPTALTLGPHGNQYEVITLTSLTGDNSPFKILEKFPHAAGHIADQSIAIIGTGKNPPYYMAVTYASGKNPGAAEELLDQTTACGSVK
ncbi:MAG: CDP-diacylglycerol diphosphatase [Acetobacteraceae bacterium]